MTCLHRCALVLALLLAFCGSAQAQAVSNPRSVSFVASPDHAAIDGYELDILTSTGTVVQTLNVGKPTPVGTEQLCTVALNVQPVAFGVGYTVRVRAKAGTVYSVYEPSVNNFTRQPGNPTSVTLLAK